MTTDELIRQAYASAKAMVLECLAEARRAWADGRKEDGYEWVRQANAWAETWRDIRPDFEELD